MASELKTNLITPASSTTVTIGESGDTISCGGNATGFGGGKVLQVVQDTLTAPWTTTSTSYTPVVGLSVSITPAATSKVLVLGNLTGSSANGTGGACCVKRDSTFIHTGDTASNRHRSLSSLRVDHPNTTYSVPINYLDTHGADGSTAVTYTWQIFTESGTVYVNRDYSYSDVTYYGTYASSIIAVEIGA